MTPGEKMRLEMMESVLLANGLSFHPEIAMPVSMMAEEISRQAKLEEPYFRVSVGGITVGYVWQYDDGAWRVRSMIGRTGNRTHRVLAALQIPAVRALAESIKI